MLLLAFVTAWVAIRGFETVWGETRDRYVKSVGQANGDWHPRKVRRHARVRAGMHLLSEVAEGFPSLRQAWNEHWLTAKAERAEAASAGHTRLRDLWERLDQARKTQQAAAAPGTGTAEPVPGADGTRPPLTVLPGRAVPLAGTGTGEPGEVPESVPEPESPASGTGDSWWHRPDELPCEGCAGSGRNAGGTDACPACRGWGSAPPDPDAPEAPEGTICTSCGNPARLDDPVLADQGGPIHRSHAVDLREMYDGALERMQATSPEGAVRRWDDPLPAAVQSVNGTAPAAPSATEGAAPMTTSTTATAEQAETPFEGLQQVLGQQAIEARAAANHAQDELIAYAVTHGFDRDQAVMAQLQAIHDAAEAHAAAAEGAQRTLAANHAEGAEYHGTGQDAHASAFRPA